MSFARNADWGHAEPLPHGAVVVTTDAELRAIVSDSDRDGYHARHESGHATAMQRHRAKVVDEIARLERRQDDLLDRMAR